MPEGEGVMVGRTKEHKPQKNWRCGCSMNLFSAIMMLSALFFIPLLTVTNIPNTKFGF